VQECACLKFRSSHTGRCHLFPNWSNPRANIPESFLPHIHVPHKRLMKMLKQMAWKGSVFALLYVLIA
jgi:hypothetical protein